MKHILIILLSIIALPVAATSFNEGVDLLRNGEFIKAKTLFLELRESQNPKGALGLGIMYQFAYAEASANYPEAMKYYLEAAKEDVPEAIHNIGYMYEAGLGVEKNAAEAAKWYTKSANLGFSASQHDLGIMYFDGVGVAKDYAKAFALFKQGADAGVAPSYYCLGFMYTYGLGTRKDYVLAYAYLSSAKTLGEKVSPEELEKPKSALSAAELKQADAISAKLLHNNKKLPNLL